MRGEGVKNSKGECAVNSNSQEAVMRPRKVFFFLMKRKESCARTGRWRGGGRDRPRGGNLFQRYNKLSECSCYFCYHIIIIVTIIITIANATLLLSYYNSSNYIVRANENSRQNIDFAIKSQMNI